MDTTYNIRDFVINGLPQIKRHEFLADVNEILKDVQVADDVQKSTNLHEAWFAFVGDITTKESKAIDAFADKWYPQVHQRWAHARFVIRNLHAAKRINYCVRDGKLF